MPTDFVETDPTTDQNVADAPLDLDLGQDGGADSEVTPADGETPTGDDSEGQQPPTPTDSQTPPPPIKDGDVVKWLREQAKAAPDQARLFNSLRDSYFRSQEFTKLFPEMESARTIKTHLDAIGGLDGLNELQNISNDMTELYEQIDSGDPSVIDDIAQNSREGFLKLVPHALETLYRVDPQSYNSLLTPIIANTLLSSPIVDSVQLAMERLQRGETDAAMRELHRIAQTFEGLRNGASATRAGGSQTNMAPTNQPQTPSQPSPMVAQIQPVIEQFVDRTVRADIGTALGGRTLNQAAMDRVTRLVGSEIDRTLGADANYQARIGALLRSGNAERTRQFIQANVDQVRPRVVRQIITEMYGSSNTSGGTRRAGAAAPPRQQSGNRAAVPGNDGMVMLTRPPRDSDINWDKTTTTMMIAHRTELKDGRLVRWAYK